MKSKNIGRESKIIKKPKLSKLPIDSPEELK